MSSKSAVATNSFLVLNAPTKKVQDYKQMKPNGAVVAGPRLDRRTKGIRAIASIVLVSYSK